MTPHAFFYFFNFPYIFLKTIYTYYYIIYINLA